MNHLNTTQELIDDIRQGKMVIIMDDEDRENEGDLMMAASFVDAQAINFMIHHARGLICLTLTEDRAKKINISTMVEKNTAHLGTNFTVSIEAAHGVTTGISAQDRATTIKAAVAPYAQPEDLVQPGHIFPIIAKKGGVLSRAGHTEAGCDFTQLAGLEPAAVIVEILNEDGTMARRPDLHQFAKQHGLKIGTIADLIHYRLNHEKQIKRIETQTVDTFFGEFNLYVYRDEIAGALHCALVKGDIHADKPCSVRVQTANLVDALLLKPKGKRWYLAKALDYISKEGGVLVLLNEQHQAADWLQQISAFNQENTGTLPNLRHIGLGSQILADLGVGKMRLLSSPRKMSAISGFGLEVVEYISLEEK
ncbi:MAG: bifunctional 3,4-dihydroxy-2-butanone-4-phosphate synthase/GTP cyclohydrolase II [Gammaproteobacteria bacterium]|jgi:3,4-dihydroxy 2-butanone 4-phosphate synthase/GTP cyclohydrolase II